VYCSATSDRVRQAYMDCGTFRENHGVLLDESVSDAELAELRRHLDECATCAAHDTAVRRALLLFRNMPSIEPSSDFSVRLHERLRRIRAESGPRADRGDQGDVHRHPHRSAYRGPGAGTFAGLAASVIAAGYLIVAASSWAPAAGPLAMAPVVSAAPATDPSADQATAMATAMANAVANAVANTAANDAASGLSDARRQSDTGSLASVAGLTVPAFLAAVPAGSPVWPTTVLAARAPARLATMQIKLTSLGR
jgi:hypothetical protein